MKIKLKCPTCDYRTEYEIEDKLKVVKTHIQKEIEFHSQDMTEGAWLSEHLEVILKILECSEFKEKDKH